MRIENWLAWAQFLSILFGALMTVVGVIWKISKKIDKMAEEYKPNGGSSLRDAINRIEKKIDRIDKDLVKLSGKFEQHVVENNE